MRRYLRSLTALAAAYALVLATFLGALATANSSGNDHLILCITSGMPENGAPTAPDRPREHGLCCLVCTGGETAPALASDANEPSHLFFDGMASGRHAGVEVPPSNTPRTAPARGPPSRA